MKGLSSDAATKDAAAEPVQAWLIRSVRSASTATTARSGVASVVSTSPSQTSAQAAVAALSWRSVVRIDDGELDVVLVEPVAQRPVDGTHASVVVALTDQVGGGTVLTSDPRGLSALAGHTKHGIRIGTV